MELSEQPQTFRGRRGDTPLLRGQKHVLTYKDVYEAFFVGINRASGRDDDNEDIYGVDLNAIDIVAAAQNMCCALEQKAGIFPNIPSNPDYYKNRSSIFVWRESQAMAYDLAEAIRLTVEYVGNDMLPALKGWSWFDALDRYYPEMAQVFVDKPIHFKNVSYTSVLFSGNNKPETLSEVVGQGVGAASMCWEDMSCTGVFNDKQASKIVDDILTWVQTNYAPKNIDEDVSPPKHEKLNFTESRRNPKPFQSKPFTVHAMQWTGDNIHDLWNWITAAGLYGPIPAENSRLATPARLYVLRDNVWMDLEVGWWIIRDKVGYYPCTQKNFELLFEEVKE